MFKLLLVGRCRIPDWLEKYGMAPSDLARKTGISRSRISNYINEYSKPDIKNAKNIASVFNCHIDDLYEWINDAGRD